MFRKILAPTDLSEPSFHAMRQAMSLAKERDAELTLLRVLSNTETATNETSLAVEKRHLDEMVTNYAPSDLKTHTVVAQGDITTEILRVAREGNFELIIMATHGSKGWREFVLGSITGEVVRSAPCPVLTIGNWAATSENGNV